MVLRVFFVLIIFRMVELGKPLVVPGFENQSTVIQKNLVVFRICVFSCFCMLLLSLLVLPGQAAKMEHMYYLSKYMLQSGINGMGSFRIHQRIIKVLSSGICIMGKCIFSILVV